MSDGFERLKEIGAQKIHEQTHIQKGHAHSIVNKKFTKMNKIQYLGFISILEREYSINLDVLRDEAKAYFKESEEEGGNDEVVKNSFVVAQRKKSYTKYYVMIALLILIVVINNLFITQESKTTPKIDNENSTQITQNIDNENSIETTQNIDNEKIIQPTQPTQNIVTKTEVSEPVIQEEEIAPIVAPKITPRVLKITPNEMLWMGYIDLNTNKKYQKTFSDEFELDPNGHWIFALGHGSVNFEIGDKINKYNTHKNMRFEYKNGELKKLTYQDFLVLSKGVKW